ncbi:MAG: SDR family oxidoreductase [Acidimicrobiales bacterium]|nr:SDR family oxidoreductase [Acidimicrobiales bacterium]
MTADPDLFRLDGRVAVVTGAAQGIGEAIARAFAASGADVAICDRDASGLERVANAIDAAGRTATTGVLDVRDSDAVSEFAKAVQRAYGHIDTLINNAGGGFSAPLLDISPNGERALVDENFTSALACIRAFVPLMPDPVPGSRRGGGSVINITSIEAHRAAPGFAVYAAMKAALANVTKSLALELADRHVRVNCIAPDMIPTPGVGDLEIATPLPYAGHPDDVAAAALFLASPAAGFITGVTIHVDGGNLAASGWKRGADGTFAL